MGSCFSTPLVAIWLSTSFAGNDKGMDKQFGDEGKGSVYCSLAESISFVVSHDQQKETGQVLEKIAFIPEKLISLAAMFDDQVMEAESDLEDEWAIEVTEIDVSPTQPSQMRVKQYMIQIWEIRARTNLINMQVAVVEVMIVASIACLFSS